jgi:hypothetical protein
MDCVVFLRQISSLRFSLAFSNRWVLNVIRLDTGAGIGLQ